MIPWSTMDQLNWDFLPAGCLVLISCDSILDQIIKKQMYQLGCGLCAIRWEWYDCYDVEGYDELILDVPLLFQELDQAGHLPMQLHHHPTSPHRRMDNVRKYLHFSAKTALVDNRAQTLTGACSTGYNLAKPIFKPKYDNDNTFHVMAIMYLDTNSQGCVSQKHKDCKAHLTFKHT